MIEQFPKIIEATKEDIANGVRDYEEIRNQSGYVFGNICEHAVCRCMNLRKSTTSDNKNGTDAYIIYDGEDISVDIKTRNVNSTTFTFNSSVVKNAEEHPKIIAFYKKIEEKKMVFEFIMATSTIILFEKNADGRYRYLRHSQYDDSYFIFENDFDKLKRI